MDDTTDSSAMLAAVAARLKGDEDEYSGGVVDQNVRDRAYLLALVRDQKARLDKVKVVAYKLAERGARIEEEFVRNGDGSIHSVRAAGLGDGYREAAKSISAALRGGDE